MTVPVHRAGLHWLLWERQGAAGSLRIDQRALAEQVGVTPVTMNKVLRRMEREGRLTKVPGAGPTSRLFVVRDPSTDYG